MQLRERRRSFTRRRDALQRVQGATGELEARIAEVQAQDEHLVRQQARVDALAAETVAAAKGLGQAAMPRQDAA